jgi:hypothetical protein
VNLQLARDRAERARGLVEVAAEPPQLDGLGHATGRGLQVSDRAIAATAIFVDPDGRVELASVVPSAPSGGRGPPWSSRCAVHPSGLVLGLLLARVLGLCIALANRDLGNLLVGLPAGAGRVVRRACPSRASGCGP